MSDIKKYTIEVHGDSDVLYQDRNSGMHGLNLVTLTDKAFNCDFEHLESLLNKGEQYDKLTSRVAELEAELSTKNAIIESISEHEIDSSITSKDSDFEKGAKSLFNAILYMCANSWHTCPERNKAYQKDNDLLLERADRALMDVSEFAHAEWKDVNAAYNRISELEDALVELMDKASECYSWESFPEQYLEDARKALGE